MSERAVDHLVHGMGTALEAPTWPAVTVPEASEILARFPAAGQFESLDWHSPRPFSAAALVRTDQGEFVLKRHHHRLRSPAALAEEHAFMAHVRARNVAVPEVMATRAGAGSIAVGDWTYELHRKAAGVDLYRDRPSWTAFLSHDHAFAAGAALARLHVAAQGFAMPGRGAHPLVASLSILTAPDPLEAAEIFIEARPAVSRFLADRPWRADLARLFATFGPGLAERLAGESPLWTHNDWHPSNLLWTANGEVSTVFDFGLATRTCALHDVATAIERTAIAWLDLAGGDRNPFVDLTGAAQLLAGYRTVLPLTAGQVETIVRLLPLVHVEFALSEVHYFAGILNDQEQAELAWRGYAIGHADWFASGPGRDFLERLEQGARI
jgi:Ser/Thr protein kinase RdoA (MazF antagonist)